jgi:DNA topoisomerase IB
VGNDDGRIVDVGSTEVNAYLRAITRAIFTAKDFRTWGGTVTAAEALDSSLGPPRSPTDAKRKINAAIDAAAERLNNTRAVCRKELCTPTGGARVLCGWIPGRHIHQRQETSATVARGPRSFFFYGRTNPR